MAVPGSSVLYSGSTVVDATVPYAPFAAVPMSCDPDTLVDFHARAGVSLAVFTVVDDFPNSIERTIKLLAENRRYFLSRPDKFVLASSAAGVRRAKAEEKLAVTFAFQGTNALLGDLSLVEVYRRLGVVQMLLAYNAANLVADGCHEGRNSGLTSFGRGLIAEMNRVGIVVDVTHVGLRSSLEAIELTSKPPVFSHSTPKRFSPHDRNITDEQIRACAAKDGVICLSGVGLFMGSQFGEVSASKLADTIDYVAQLVGPRHAGIGLDFSPDPQGIARYLRTNPDLYGGGGQYPDDFLIDFLPPSALPDVAQQLALRGFSDADVRGILGENYLRVLDANTLAT